jgi:hypothetical protein
MKYEISWLLDFLIGGLEQAEQHVVATKSKLLISGFFLWGL